MFLRIAGIILAVVGAAGFLMPFWIGVVFGEAHELELPLTDISDVAISANGDLYFALTFAGRVQKYSSGGKFDKSFKINAAGGSFCLEIVEGELAVYIARRDAEDRYDLNGNATRQNTPFDEYAYREKCERNERIVDVKSTLQDVTVSLADAQNSIVIKRQPWHFIVFGPFVSWITFVIGLFLIPEWRYAIFSAFARSREPNKDAKPEGAFLKAANFVLNFLYTLYGLIFTTVGGLAILFATKIEDKGSSAFVCMLGVFFVVAFHSLGYISFGRVTTVQLGSHLASNLRLAPPDSSHGKRWGCCCSAGFFLLFSISALMRTVAFWFDEFKYRT